MPWIPNTQISSGGGNGGDPQPVAIFGFATVPDDTGEAAFEKASANFGSNDIVQALLLGLGSALAAEPTLKHGVYGRFKVPADYTGSPVIRIEWSATLTSGDVTFDFDYNAVSGDGTETLDPAAWQESVTVTDTAPGTARRKLSVTVSLTAENLAAGDEVDFFFGRDGAAGGDTMAGRAYVADVRFEYANA